MRVTNQVLALALAGALNHSVLAATAEPAPDPGANRLGLLKQASVLLQRKVVDEHQKNLGKVYDLALDPVHGRVRVVLVAYSSDEVTLVPASVFSDASVACLVINADKKVFATAPRLAKAGLFNALNETRVDECYRHFGQANLPNPEGSVAPLASAVTLVSAPVRGQGNEPLGAVRDIMLDLPFGRIVYYVVEPAGAASGAGQLYVVPPSVIRPGDSPGFLMLQADRTGFLAGPSFQNEFWNDLAFPSLAEAVHKYYGTGASSAGARPVANVTPASGETADAPVRSDPEITRAVLAEIVREAHGFLRVNIAVTTLNGRVTLRGQVKNEGQRKQIVSAAERVVGKANVDNRLEGGVRDSTAKL